MESVTSPRLTALFVVEIAQTVGSSNQSLAEEADRNPVRRALFHAFHTQFKIPLCDSVNQRFTSIE